MYRTHTCGELRMEHVGQQVTLAGWVQVIRKISASLSFVDLRDRYGLTQLVIGDQLLAKFSEQPLGREFVIQAKGVVRERSNKNPEMSTGDIEIVLDDYTVLNGSKVPPISIMEGANDSDELRMKYRYLDLRRNAIKQNLELRYRVGREARNYLHTQGFMDIETPFLIKSTPEGARDFVVPSRMNANEFYALPQSPQTFKQLLMVSGYDRYYQIVKCFRDEDLRADRQPEFTQIDCEMSFVEQEDILNTFENMLKHIFREIKGIDMKDPFPRMTFDDAMEYYGNDKPDIRFEMKLVTMNETVKNKGFKVFDDAELVVAINAKGCAEYTRKQLDELTDWVKRPQIGMSGLIYVKHNTDGTLKSSVDKFFNEEQLKEWAAKTGSQPGDLILVLAGREERTRKAMSELRLEMGERLGLRDKNVFAPLWVIDFPLFEYAEEENRWVARHHPFTSPKPEQIALMDDLSQYGKIKANAYDIVLNGTEIGGGSIRIFQRDLQEKMFAALGMSDEEAAHKFGFLLGAFEYGAPPHGGIAFGFDRLCSLLGGSESIRDFIAFPKNNSGRDVMLDAPAAIDDYQLEELHISLVKQEPA
ncbi:MAG: aspartate--tRNA ligase [Chitinophaga sp.]|uniref:aspartate--tRNA ligase n=1 Tax=Chitinophaga sp. TaxID=1869181 RepID=UPI0025C3660C|nr:aspartate--tRNA ligase [Chitinophaga sp.]MBV8254235.1 aspartate--tRNA ligase [Chitinophaga sp.]